MNAKRESGLARWARRKADVKRANEGTERRGAALPAAAEPSDPVAAAPTQPPAEGRSHEAPASGHETVPEHLPEIETLDYDSDYSGFLSADIEDSVRNMALRRLWRSNPVLANVDGLVDYDDDFSDAATVIEGMKSVYRVGRGMLQDEPEDAETSSAAAEPEADATVLADADGPAQTQPEADGATEPEIGNDKQAEAPSGTDDGDDKSHKDTV